MDKTNKELSEQTNNALIAARELYSELISLLRSLQKAKGWSVANLLGGVFFKANRNDALRQAEDSARSVKRLNRRYQAELEDLAILIKDGNPVTKSKLVLDTITNNFITEWLIHADLLKSIKDNTRYLEELKKQITALEEQEAYIDEKMNMYRTK